MCRLPETSPCHGISTRRVIRWSQRRLSRISAGVLCLVLFGIHSASVDSTDKLGDIPLHGEFPIGKEGRLILLPVRLGQEGHLFLMDTGASRTATDVSLKNHLGKAQGKQVLLTAGGRKWVDSFEWPEATIQGQAFQSDRTVVAIDFTDLRRSTNEEIRGVVGMDVLRKCCIEIDFDRGRLRFLDLIRRPPEELGIKIPLKFTRDGAPLVDGVVGDEQSESFLIDTGAHGNSLRSTVFDQLVAQERISLGSSFKSMTPGGAIEGSRGRIRSLTIGSVEQDNLRVSRMNLSTIGLRYLSRFVVTFDFPGSAIYLKRGEHFSKSEPKATSGMALNWIDGSVVVTSVRKNGPAEAAGILAGDVLFEIDDAAIADYDHFALRELLTSDPGKRVTFQIRRGNDNVRAALVLAED